MIDSLAKMIKDSKTKVIFFLIILNVFLVGGWLCKSYIDNYRARTESVRLAEGDAKVAEQQGEMSRNEYMELTSIRFDVSDKKSLSDEQINWLCSLSRQSLSKSDNASLVRRGDVALTIRAIKSFNNNQKLQIIRLASDMVDNPENKGDDSDKIFALQMLAALKDKEAIPAILPLLDDQRRDVQQAVKYALKASGYKSN